MPMSFVRAEGMESSNAEDAHKAAEHIGLLVIHIHKLGGFFLDILDGSSDVRRAKLSRKSYGLIKAVLITRHQKQELGWY